MQSANIGLILQMSLPFFIPQIKGWPFKITILGSIIWLSFFIVWMILSGSLFSLYVHIGVFFFSLLLFIGFTILIWVNWLKKIIPEVGWNFIKSIGILNYIIYSLLLPYMILISLSFFLMFFADYFTLLQNILVMFFSIVLIIILLSLLWKKAPISPFRIMQQMSCPLSSNKGKNGR